MLTNKRTSSDTVNLLICVRLVQYGARIIYETILGYQCRDEEWFKLCESSVFSLVSDVYLGRTGIKEFFDTLNHLNN